MTEPIVEPETEGLAMAAKRKAIGSRAPAASVAAPRGHRLRSCSALMPVVLTLLYLPSFVHPVSTLMLKDLATFYGLRPALGAARRHRAGARQFGHHVGGRPVLLRIAASTSAELKVVIDDALAGEATRGASTITMQTVKNLYLWHRPLGTRAQGASNCRSPSISTLVLPKRRIMEIYLNIAEWGPNIYGIEAAAQHHFGRLGQER